MVRDDDSRLTRILTWPTSPGPSRSARLTSLLGVALGAAFGVCFVTGVLSHLIQHPPGWFWWPSRPAGLYRFTQGLHVATGLATVPLLGAKLWSVYPRLFIWPPVRGVAHAAERASVAALVAAALFQVVSGVLNTAHLYAPMPFFFTTAHYWIAWLAVGALLTHIGVQLPAARTALRRRHISAPQQERAGEQARDEGTGGERAGEEARDEGTGDERTAEEARDQGTGGQRTAEEAREKGRAGEGGKDEESEESKEGSEGEAAGGKGAVARRQVLVAVGVAAGVVTVATVGQTVAPLAAVSVLAPRRRGDGPQGLAVNRTAAAAGVREAALDPAYRLVVAGFGREVALSLADLAAMPQHSAVLPIACVEGWSATATWSGVRLRDLAGLLGRDVAGVEAEVVSLQASGRYRSSVVAGPHLGDDRTLIALRLGREALDADHGFPARLIAPNRPGVLQTKWVARISVRRAR
ncbi:molybdopterin-dependent oxidoreductase [Actinoplanes sp. NPDC048988]|uniref:molybdopterin-dependent oxidoreductase n=1 Tax=Actinoplanes sp. NPDC048988 TaxID=3363901 RepID=UPI00371E20FC